MLPARVPKALRIFVYLLVSLSVGCIVTERICIWLGFGYPYDFPLLPYRERFQDVGLYIDRYAHYHSRMFFDFGGPPSLYPAPATILYKLLFLTGHAGVAIVAFSLIAIPLFVWWCARGFVDRGLTKAATAGLVAATALCSYPFAFEFRQGNIEIFLWAFTCLSVVLFLRRAYLPAAILVGIVASMKLYPFALLGMFLARKRYRESVVAVFVAVTMTLAGLWFACPDMAYSWKRTQEGLAQFQNNYTMRSWALGQDHSCFTLIKRPLDVFADHTGRPLLETNAAALHLYLPIAGLAGFLLCFLWIRRLPVANQVICTLAAMIFLPPTSFDYTLMHLYLPWALLAFYAIEQKGQVSRSVTVAMVCFAVLFAPESEFIYHYVPLGGQIKALALLCLIAIAMRSPFRTSFDESRSLLTDERLAAAVS